MSRRDLDEDFRTVQRIKKLGKRDYDRSFTANFEKDLTVAEWQKAVWQYLIDHAAKDRSGAMAARFILTDADEFWRRVKARRDGVFLRFDEERIRAAHVFSNVLAIEKEERSKKHMLNLRNYANKVAPLWFKLLMRFQARLNAFVGHELQTKYEPHLKDKTAQ